MAVPPIVALEIGTSKVVALVGELREDGNVLITGIGEHPSTGVRKGQITGLEDAVICVKSAIEAAEESSQVEIRTVHLAVSGGHITCTSNRGEVPVSDRDEGVSPEDIEQVLTVAKAFSLPAERDVVHTICQHFCIDNQERVIKPEGMTGAKLGLDALLIHGIRNNLNNTVRVAHDVPLDVDDVVYSGLASALSVLTAEQRKSGAIVIDIGGGTTDCVAYSDGVIAFAETFGVGGDHVTNDIAMAFSIPVSQAEKLKLEHGCAVLDLESAGEKVSLPAEGGFSSSNISLKALHTVINARMAEILGIVKSQLEGHNVLTRVGAGVVVTGGCAHMSKIVDLTERTFGLPCSIGLPRSLSGVAQATEGPQYATCSGLIHWGIKMAAEQSTSSPIEWLKSIFSR